MTWTLRQARERLLALSAPRQRLLRIERQLSDAGLLPPARGNSPAGSRRLTAEQSAALLLAGLVGLGPRRVVPLVTAFRDLPFAGTLGPLGSALHLPPQIPGLADQSFGGMLARLIAGQAPPVIGVAAGTTDQQQLRAWIDVIQTDGPYPIRLSVVFCDGDLADAAQQFQRISFMPGAAFQNFAVGHRDEAAGDPPDQESEHVAAA